MDERIRRVQQVGGYQAVEFWGWKSKNLDSLQAVQQETGLAVAAMSVEPSFCLVNWGNDADLVNGVAESVKTARSLGCKTLIVTTGNNVPTETFEITRRRVVRKLKQMAAVAAAEGATLVLEPLNPLVDHPNYWLATMAQAADIVLEVDSPGLKILFDLYHQQISEGNLIANIRRYGDLVGHYHAAGVPGRHELVGGELDYRAIFAAIDATGYAGYVGLEFRPAGEADAALRQAASLV
jgi:hydroxypyruvate isomerase